jgi:type II secretory pathway component PulK
VEPVAASKAGVLRFASQRASVLIIVMWIVFGLVCIALYFGHSMSMELRAADNRAASSESDQIIQGATRMVSYVLSNNIYGPGSIPDPTTYPVAAVQVGDGRFWLIGRTNATNDPTILNCGLIDEASKLNLNFATSNMLTGLPNITADVVQNILSWANTNTSAGGGAESDTYQRLPTPYMCKNAPFETVGELRLVYNMTEDLLYGEDANLNGVLDPNENDGDKLPPSYNQDGQLNPGILEYVTVYTREPNTTTNGTTRLNVTTLTSSDQLLGVLTTNGISESRAEEILDNLGFTTGSPAPAAPAAGGRGAPTGGRGPTGGGPTTPGAGVAAAAAVPTFTSVLDFFIKSQMTAQEFAQIELSIRGPYVQGLVNVNTASATVLGCLMDSGSAQQIVSYRLSNAPNLNSLAWVSQVGLSSTVIAQAGPWLTGKSYQFTADVAALGHNGRGYRRTRFVFDTTQAAPIVLYRQDLTYLGWALGKQVRDQYVLGKKTP